MTDKNAINQLIGQSPSWMLRWGILLVALFFVLIGLLSWFIQYPDVITAKARLHTEVLPVRMEMPVDGRIDSLFAKSDTKLSEGQLLAILQAPADYDDILLIEQFCEKWTAQAAAPLAKNLKLGTIAPLWSDFVVHQKELAYFYQNDISTLKSKSIEQQIAKLEELHQALRTQEKTFQENIDLAKKARQRDTDLMEDNAASLIEVEQSTRTFLQAKQALEQHATTIISNQIQMEQLRASLLDIGYAQKKGASDKILQLQRDIAQLQTAIDLWKAQYLIFAPIGGTLHWNNTWTTGQFLTTKTSLGAITPSQAVQERIMATVFVANNGLGKIKTGGEVQIQLDAYPYQEFGVLKGQINTIPALAEDGFYKLKIELQQPLITTYQKEISFRQELEGTARITTEKRRLAERFFDRILSVVQN